MQFLASRLIVTAFAIIITSCGGSSLPGAGDFPVGDDPTSGFDTTEFFIGVANKTEINYHMRSSTAFGTACEIAGSAANTDLTCYVDVPEGDLYFSGIDLVYNVPAGMCRYLRRSTYWYYNDEPGYGPTNIDLSYTVNSAGNAIVANSCSVDGGAAVACNSNFDEVEFELGATEITPRCKYDWSFADGRPNCCLGDYTINKTVTNQGIPPAADTISTSTERLSWASGIDSIKSCIGGTGRTSWPTNGFTKSGYPVSLIQFADDGLSDVYEIPAPIKSVNNGSNLPVANFYTLTPAPLHSHGSFGTALTSTKPYYVEPLTDRNGTPMASGNDAYTFDCMDEAFEVQHRIRVYVRDWDTYADYLAYIASAGVTSVPDRPGSENVDCDGVIGPCNDNDDADDFVNGLTGGVYQTVTPANRYLNFPFHLYE